ncbi:hypothetical protein MC885_017167 [Smutsia gigantea]|nr:hypothetical protein MC885_017167 [Smutsia gigantea]
MISESHFCHPVGGSDTFRKHIENSPGFPGNCSPPFASYPLEDSLSKSVHALVPRPRPSRPPASQTAHLSLFSSPKSHTQTERQRVLKAEEQRELQKLREDELNVLGNWVGAKNQLVQQRQNMREPISDTGITDRHTAGKARDGAPT